MSVNDITGLPVLEVTSDYKVVMGAFNRNALVVSGSSVGIGVQNNGATYRLISSGDTLFSGGTMTVRWSVSAGSTFNFQVLNSGGGQNFGVRGDGYILFNTLSPPSGSFNIVDGASMLMSGGGPLSATQTKISVSHLFQVSSGSNTFTVFGGSPTINQTGGANGITRGLYINPTLTSAFDFRAIETTNGKIIFQNITSSATTEMLYYNSSTGLVSYGPKPSETDTLQIVSDRGRVTTSLSSTGTTLVASATTGYTGVFFNYTLGDGTNYRAGTVTSVVSSGSTVEFTETSTNDIGNTSPVSLSVGVSSGNINLSATTTTTGWTIKVVPQGI